MTQKPAGPHLDSSMALLLCACVPDDDARLRGAAERVRDWDAACATAALHRLTGVLHRRLVTACAETVPQAAMARLSDEAGVIARRSLLMTAQLLSVLRELDEVGVRAVPFKGPVLSQQAYGDPGLRTFWDLDLLLSTDDVLRARDVLAAAGFHGHKTPYDGPADAVLVRMGRHIGLQRADGLMVELHDPAGALRGGSPFGSAADVVGRAGSLELLGRQVPALGEDDLVLLQCTHASKHTWEDLEHVACLVSAVRGVTRRNGWPALLARAAEVGALRKVLVGTILTCLIADDQPPADVVDVAAAAPPVWALVSAALDVLVWGSARRSWTNVNYTPWLTRYEDSPAAAVRLMWRRWTLPGADDWSSLRLPPRAFPLYRVWRPVRLTAKYAGRALGDAGLPSF
ncbi:MAG TPA: nucleotidyltransferase family protein [Thermoleophilia bacterium]|nr:nucleotidyltransferase family protein [Thermoleophilia bacterium]